MHGGARGCGAPKGNRNPFQYGFYTADAIAGGRLLNLLIRRSRATLEQLKG